MDTSRTIGDFHSRVSCPGLADGCSFRNRDRSTTYKETTSHFTKDGLGRSIGSGLSLIVHGRECGCSAPVKRSGCRKFLCCLHARFTTTLTLQTRHKPTPDFFLSSSSAVCRAFTVPVVDTGISAPCLPS